MKSHVTTPTPVPSLKRLCKRHIQGKNVGYLRQRGGYWQIISKDSRDGFSFKTLLRAVRFSREWSLRSYTGRDEARQLGITA